MTYDLDDPPIGNGRAIAQLCAREGARVVCADRDARRAPRRPCGASSTRAARRRRVAADVTDPDGVTAMVAGADHELGGLDGVVYNVGIGAAQGLERATPEAWDHVHGRQPARRDAHRPRRPARARRRARRSCSSRRSPASSRAAGSRPTTSSKAALGGLMRHVAFEGAPAVDPGQRRRARADGHRRSAGWRRRAGPAGPARRCRSAARARAGRPPTPCCSCSPTRRPTSPARRSSSTAA